MSQETIEKKDRKLPIKVGCDPEFMMFYGNRPANAQAMFQSFFRNTGLLHGQGIRVIGAGEIGTEGSAAIVGEMRPNPGSSPEELTRNIGTLIKAMHDHMPLLDMSTLSIGHPIGGHMHLDMPMEFAKNAKVQSKLVRIAATMMMPIFASEHRMCAASRYTQSHYGHAHDVRYAIKGETLCIELRALTSEWMCTPRICEATIAYLAVIWHEACKRYEELSKENVVFKSQPQIEAIQRMILTDYKPMADSLVNDIGKLVRTFELYEQFKEECEFILNPSAVYAEKEKVGFELFQGWGFRDKVKPITKRSVLADKAIRSKIRTVNVDLLSSTISMPYNNDFNIQMYAKALAERTAALGWQLKHEYFFFGLKKGVEGFVAARVHSDEYFSIPENSPYKDVTHAVTKMRQRFNNVKEVSSATKIDPKTGKTRRGNINAIVVGIPYDVRQKKNIKPLIELIWRIERETLKSTPLANLKFYEEPKVEKAVEAGEITKKKLVNLKGVTSDGSQPSVTQ